MNKVLIAVDDTKASRAVLSTFHNSVSRPDEIILLHVERLEGRSMIIDMLGEAEMTTLKEMVKDTEHKENLDRKAGKILDFYKKEFMDDGMTRLKTVTRAGKPADEILKVADEEGAGLILLGYSGRKGLSRLIAGSVVSDVEKMAKVPVLTARAPIACEEPYSWRDAYAAVSVTMAVIIGMFLLGIILQGGTILH
jgi:nucleotide-binding universal stress UspA family protein